MYVCFYKVLFILHCLFSTKQQQCSQYSEGTSSKMNGFLEQIHQTKNGLGKEKISFLA